MKCKKCKADISVACRAVHIHSRFRNRTFRSWVNPLYFFLPKSSHKKSPATCQLQGDNVSHNLAQIRSIVFVQYAEICAMCIFMLDNAHIVQYNEITKRK